MPLLWWPLWNSSKWFLPSFVSPTSSQFCFFSVSCLALFNIAAVVVCSAENFSTQVTLAYDNMWNVNFVNHVTTNFHPDKLKKDNRKQTSVLVGKFKHILCSVNKNHHLFYLHWMIIRRNTYTTKWYSNYTIAIAMLAIHLRFLLTNFELQWHLGLKVPSKMIPCSPHPPHSPHNTLQLYEYPHTFNSRFSPFYLTNVIFCI